MEKRKVTHKASWMEEPDQFRVSRPSPPPSERHRCPTCDIPLRTSPEGGLFCWICERRYDPSQLLTVKQPEPQKTTLPKVGHDRSDIEEEAEPEEEVDFELDMEEGSEDDEAPEVEAEEENAPDAEGDFEVTDEGETEEIKPLEEGDEDEERLEFELEEETPSDNEGTQVGDGSKEEVTEDDIKDKAENGTESWDGETSEVEEELEFEVSDGTDDEEGAGDEEEKGSDAKGDEDEEDVDFELELDVDDGVEGEEVVVEDEDASPGPEEHGPKVKKRFIDQSEIEFD